MPRLAATLSMIFNELLFLTRFYAAAAAGFTGVEYLFSYDLPVEIISAELRKHNLVNVMFNLPAGNWAVGERGTTCLPGREDEFRAGLATAIAYAKQLDVTRVHAMAGIISQNFSPAVVHETYIANLKYAAAEFAKHDMTLLIEAINTRDIPGFYLNKQSQSYAVLEEVGALN